MKYCLKCGSEIKHGAKFCTHCGTSVLIQKPKQKLDVVNAKVSSPPSIIIKKLFRIAVVIVGLFFLAKTFIPEFDDFTSSFSTSKSLSKLVGKWHDPTGQLLGSSQATIKFRKMGDALVGEDENKNIYIKLLHYEGNSYGGFVVLKGNDASFEVTYDKTEDKLIFFSTLTKTSWYIRRFK